MGCEAKRYDGQYRDLPVPFFSRKVSDKIRRIFEPALVEV